MIMMLWGHLLSDRHHGWIIMMLWGHLFSDRHYGWIIMMLWGHLLSDRHHSWIIMMLWANGITEYPLSRNRSIMEFLFTITPMSFLNLLPYANARVTAGFYCPSDSSLSFTFSGASIPAYFSSSFPHDHFSSKAVTSSLICETTFHACVGNCRLCWDCRLAWMYFSSSWLRPTASRRLRGSLTLWRVFQISFASAFSFSKAAGSYFSDIRMSNVGRFLR